MISKKLCEHLGGEIFVESEQGKGSKFSFTVQLQGVRVRPSLPKMRTLVCFKHQNRQMNNEFYTDEGMTSNNSQGVFAQPSDALSRH